MSTRAKRVEAIQQPLRHAARGVPLDEALDTDELRRTLEPAEITKVVSAAGVLADKYRQDPPATWQVANRRADLLTGGIVDAMDRKNPRHGDPAGAKAALDRQRSRESARVEGDNRTGLTVKLPPSGGVTQREPSTRAPWAEPL